MLDIEDCPTHGFTPLNSDGKCASCARDQALSLPDRTTRELAAAWANMLSSVAPAPEGEEWFPLVEWSAPLGCGVRFTISPMLRPVLGTPQRPYLPD